MESAIGCERGCAGEGIMIMFFHIYTFCALCNPGAAFNQGIVGHIQKSVELQYLIFEKSNKVENEKKI